MFFERIDASSISKTVEMLVQFLDKYMETLGETNIVQVITDNAVNFVLAVNK